MISGLKVKFKTISEDDTDFMLSLLNNFNISSQEGKHEFLISFQEQTNWLNNKNSEHLNYIILDQLKNKIGYFSFKYVDHVSRVGKIAIKLDEKYRGKGYAIDSLKTMTSYLFLIFNLHRLETHIIAYNNNSLRLFEKAQWFNEGVARESIFMHGTFHDNTLWSLLRKEFLNNAENKQYIDLFMKKDSSL